MHDINAPVSFTATKMYHLPPMMTLSNIIYCHCTAGGSSVGRDFLTQVSCQGSDAKGSAELTFHIKQDGKDMTVAEYHTTHYHISVKHPEVPCINVGRPTKPVWLPPDVCWIAPGQRRLKLD